MWRICTSRLAEPPRCTPQHTSKRATTRACQPPTTQYDHHNELLNPPLPWCSSNHPARHQLQHDTSCVTQSFCRAHQPLSHQHACVAVNNLFSSAHKAPHPAQAFPRLLGNAMLQTMHALKPSMAAQSHNPHTAAQLRRLIFYHLDNDLLQNALFFAGRLHGLDPRGGDAAHLLALCHLKLGQLKPAYDYSREKGFRGHHLGCAYVFAQACLSLERYQDGILALERSRGQWAARNDLGMSNRFAPPRESLNRLL